MPMDRAYHLTSSWPLQNLSVSLADCYVAAVDSSVGGRLRFIDGRMGIVVRLSQVDWNVVLK